jgi:hypothetical protein
MPELEYDADEEPSDGEPDAAADPGATVVEMPTADGQARVTLPADADAEEVAALVSAVAARLNEGEAESATEPGESDRWRLAGRLGARRRYELPRQCRRGGGWKAASRCP